MVTEWGMSEKLGMIAYGENSQEVFLGHSVTQSKNLSEETARQIDAEIRRIIDEAYARCKGILSENIDELHLLAKGLLEHETLSGDEIRLVIKGEPVVRQPAGRAGRRPAAAACRARAGRRARDRAPAASTRRPRPGT